jgi:23S rRNA (cytosine1962-C5)-methyltransferase
MEMIEELMAQVSQAERREIQILERRGQSADHPVAVSCLESNYLKCVIARIV